jgi:hypothetical protein
MLSSLEQSFKALEASKSALLNRLELHFSHHLRQVDRTESLVTAKCGS